MPINETVIRLAAFIGVFTAMALWKAFVLRRPRSNSRFARRSNNLGNLGIVALNTVL